MTANVHSGARSDPSEAAQASAAPLQSKRVLGWREWVTFPDFGNVRIKAKVDTGARTSALHASNIEVFEEDGRQMVAFNIYPRSRDAEPVVQCTAPLLARRRIRNSGGQDSFRYIISAKIKLGDQIWPVEISLTRRDRLQLRMLLGRTALENRYLVDPDKCYLHGK